MRWAFELLLLAAVAVVALAHEAVHPSRDAYISPSAFVELGAKVSSRSKVSLRLSSKLSANALYPVLPPSSVLPPVGAPVVVPGLSIIPGMDELDKGQETTGADNENNPTVYMPEVSEGPGFFNPNLMMNPFHSISRALNRAFNNHEAYNVIGARAYGMQYTNRPPKVRNFKKDKDFAIYPRGFNMRPLHTVAKYYDNPATLYAANAKLAIGGNMLPSSADYVANPAALAQAAQRAHFNSRYDGAHPYAPRAPGGANIAGPRYVGQGANGGGRWSDPGSNSGFDQFSKPVEMPMEWRFRNGLKFPNLNEDGEVERGKGYIPDSEEFVHGGFARYQNTPGRGMGRIGFSDSDVSYHDSNAITTAGSSQGLNNDLSGFLQPYLNPPDAPADKPAPQ